MKNNYPHHLPKGWTLGEVKAIADYYDNQPDDEGAREIETAAEVDDAIIVVPRKMVPQIRKLIANSCKGKTKTRNSKSRRAA
jgi:hypothetical protein